MIYLYWLHCKLKVIIFFRRLVWGWDGKDSKHWRESYFSQPPPCWDVHETARNTTNLQGRQSAPRRTPHCAIESEFVHDKAKEGHKATNSNLSQVKKRIFTLQWPLIPVFLYIPLPNLPERHRTIWWFRWEQFLIWTCRQHWFYRQVSRQWGSLRMLYTLRWYDSYEQLHPAKKKGSYFSASSESNMRSIPSLERWPLGLVVSDNDIQLEFSVRVVLSEAETFIIPLETNIKSNFNLRDRVNCCPWYEHALRRILV